MCHNRVAGLSFWQNLFVAAVSFFAFSFGMETGLIGDDFWNNVYKSFADYNASFERAK